jgi:membrane-bound metal-dependent hydrolase YbcI (DUF457 family)
MVDLIAHFVVGLWLYKYYPNPVVVILAAIPDADHLLGYFYDRWNHKRIEIPKLLHLAYRPRSWVHSILGMFVIGLPLLFFFPWRIIFVPLFSHLLLDALDKQGVYIIPKLTKLKIRGKLPVGYLPEDPEYMLKHKRSHIPSILLIIAIAVLRLMNIA